MRSQSFRAEAEHCRRQAANFVGRPERPFLLGIAQAFEELAAERHELEAAHSSQSLHMTSGLPSGA
jgi:hypothetical protein